MDLAAENIILTRLHRETPTLGTLSEEAGQQGNHEQYWLIDPLDGSANFQHGNPTFAVVLALVVNKMTVCSVIYLPMLHEIFTAIQHQGAYANGKRIATSQISSLDQAIIHAGDMMKEGRSEITNQRMQDLARLFTRARRIRMIGSAATDLAYLACGRADTLVNYAQKPWDREAGKLLLLEAGGTATEYQQPNGEKLFLYSNGLIHRHVEELLKEP